MLERVRRAVAEAARLAREKGGSIEGWLWLLLMPDGLVGYGRTVEVEYYTDDWECVRVYTVDLESLDVTESVKCYGEGDEPDGAGVQGGEGQARP